MRMLWTLLLWLPTGYAISTALASDLKQPMIGEPAPLFVLKSLAGKDVSLEQQRGKLLVLHFATSW